MKCYVIILLGLFANNLLGQDSGVPDFDKNRVLFAPFSGNTTDLSGYGNHGINTDAVISLDRNNELNSSFQFNGVTSYIDFGNNASLDIRDGFSISMWFNATGTKYQTLISRGYGANGSYNIDMSYSSGSYKFLIFLEGQSYLSTFPIPLGWNHIALTMKSGTNGIKLYLNNELINEFTAVTDLVGSSPYNLRVGSDPQDNAYFFEGFIDEATIFTRYLNSIDIKALYSTFKLDYETGAGFGNALHFGDLDYVSLPTSPVSNLTDFTFETWVKWDGGINHDQRIIEFGYGNNEYLWLSAKSFGIVREINGVQDFQEVCYSGDCLETLDVGSWQHLAVTFDNQNDVVVIYKNGDEIARSNNFTHDAINIIQTFLPFNRIGSGSFTSNTFTGSLDETRLWNYAKTVEEIGEFINLPISGNDPNLLYYYSYDQGVSNGDNTNIEKILKGQNVDLNGDLSGFALNGSSSNFIKSTINQSNITITDVKPKAAIVGEKIQIRGAGFAPVTGYNKVFIGTQECVVIKESLNLIEVIVPDMEIGASGNTTITVLNSNGNSEKYNFSVQYNRIEYPNTFDERVLIDFLRLSHRVETIDIDNDGLPEIIASGLNLNDQVLMKRNLGEMVFSDDIELSPYGSRIILTGDINNDGFDDMVSCESNDEIVWYENKGDGSFIRNVIINNTLSFSAKLGDLDNDGDLDLVASLNQTNSIAYFENIGGSFSPTPVEIYFEDFLDIRYLELADLNNDNYLDIVAGDYHLDVNKALGAVYLIENPGDLKFNAPLILDANLEYIQSVQTADINEDNNMDIIVAANYLGGTILYRNLGNFTFEVDLIPNTTQPNFAYPTDINADGNTDLIVSNYYGDTNVGGISLHLNNGLTQFERIDLSSGRFSDPRQVISADLDSDGDLDILGTWLIDNKVAIYENVLSSNDIKTFEVDGQTDAASIDLQTHVVDITVANNIRLDKVVPIFTISRNASAFINTAPQVSGENVVDFSNVEILSSYIIKAENGDEQLWNVYLHPLPGIPVLNDPTNFTASSCNISWTASSYSDSYLIEVSNDNFKSIDSLYSETNSTTLNLTAGSHYSVRIKGVNLYGYAENHSNVIEFTAVPATPAVLEVTNISSSSAILQWENILGAEYYEIDIALDESFSNILPGFNSRIVYNLSESIPELTAGNQYWFRLRAVNSSGKSGNSQAIQFQLLPEKVILQLAGLTENSATLNWNPVVGADLYTINLFTTDGLVSTTELSAAETSLTVNGLLSNTSYNFEIIAGNISGNSELYSIEVITLSKAPLNITYDNLTQTGVRITWQESYGGTSYLIDLSKDNFISFVSGYDGRRTTILSEDITELDPATNYQLRIRAANERGSSQYSETLQFLTIPDNPQARDATSITNTSFKANWDAVSGSGISYDLEVSTSANFSSIVESATNIGGLSYDVTGLPEGVSHWYRVKSKNASGQSGYSNIVLIEQPLAINNLTYNEETSKGNGSSLLPLNFSVYGGQNQYNVNLFFKGILGRNWNLVELKSSNNDYYYEFTGADLDQMGVEFRIEVSDGKNNLVSGNYFTYWTDVQQVIPLNDFKGQWQLFSVPYVLEDDFIETIFDELGEFEYKSQWRLMHYDGERHVDFGGGINRIELGKGYWINSHEKATIEIGNASINRETPFVMELHPGWNQIGNPYNVTISWDNVRETNNVLNEVGRVYNFNSETESFIVGNQINPFSGGFVWADAPSSVGISLTEHYSGGRIEEDEITNKLISEDEWIFEILLQNNDKEYNLAKIGMHPDALESKDNFDKMKIPRFMNFVEMYTMHDDYFYPWFSDDISPTSEEKNWYYQLESNFLSGLTTIKWDNTGLQNVQEQLWLIDEKTGRFVNMAEVSSYSFNLNSKHSFSFHFIGGPSNMQIPFNRNLSNPYPNPTNGNSQIDVLLPNGHQSYDLQLDLFNLQGQLIKTVASGKYSPGVYSFVTKLEEEANVRNGVYIYRLVFRNLDTKPVYKKFIFRK